MRLSRAAFAAEVGRLILKLSENSHNDEILNENKQANENWLVEMGKSSGTPTQTLYRWWSAFAAEVGRICQKLLNLSNENDLSNFDKGWLVDIAAKSGQTRQTLHNWWSAFCKDAGLSITPKQASDENRSAFFAWLDAQKQAEDAEKARKLADAEAEKSRKEQEAKARRMNAEKQELMEYLDETGKLCGTDIVKEWVNEWLQQN